MVGQETYYDEEFQSFQVLRINLPLEGKVSPEYLRAVLEAEGEEQRGIERRSVADHEHFIARMTGEPMVSPTASISASGHQSAVFLSLQKFVHQFNTSYVLVKGFIDHAGLKVSDACARLREDVLSKAKARQGGAEFALTKRVVVEVQMGVESLVQAAIYKKLFSGLCELYSKEEDITQLHLRQNAVPHSDTARHQRGHSMPPTGGHGPPRTPS